MPKDSWIWRPNELEHGEEGGNLVRAADGDFLVLWGSAGSISLQEATGSGQGGSVVAPRPCTCQPPMTVDHTGGAKAERQRRGT